MDDQSIVALVRRGMEAFNAGDMQTVLGNVDPGVVLTFPGKSTIAGDYEGHDGLASFFGRLAERIGGLPSMDVENVLAKAGRSVLFSRVGLTADGEQHSFTLAIFGDHGADGAIRRIWFLPDRQELVDRIFA